MDATTRYARIAAMNVELRYEGPDVDDGSMPIADMVSALQGFASAYGKMASAHGVKGEHRLRVTGMSRGSAVIALEVWDAIATNATQIEALAAGIGAAGIIVAAVAKVVSWLRHTKNQPFTVTNEIIGSTVTVQNFQGATLVFPANIHALAESGAFTKDVGKMVSPLARDSVNSFTLSSDIEDEHVAETITAEDAEYLLDDEPDDDAREETLIGVINSMNKKRKTGTIRVRPDVSVRFRLVAKDPTPFWSYFPAKTPLKFHGIARYVDGVRSSIDVLSIEVLQESFLPRSDDGE